MTLGLLGWLWYRRADIYRPLRNTLVAINVIGLAVFWLYPTAPPRLLAGSGFDDVVASTDALGGWHTGPLATVANQFAAMPSLHMAWAVWCSLVLWSISRRTWVRAVAVLYPCVTCVAVLATGNHYLLDVLAGVATAGLAVAARTRLEVAWRARGGGLAFLRPYMQVPKLTLYRQGRYVVPVAHVTNCYEVLDQVDFAALPQMVRGRLGAKSTRAGARVFSSVGSQSIVHAQFRARTDGLCHPARRREPGCRAIPDASCCAYLDVVLLVLAVPVALALGAPALGLLIAVGAWLVQRVLAHTDQRWIAHARAPGAGSARSRRVRSGASGCWRGRSSSRAWSAAAPTGSQRP